MRRFRPILVLFLIIGTRSFAADAPRTLTAVALNGMLGRDGLFAGGAAHIAFSPDNSFLCLPDRFGRTVTAVDPYGKELWKIDLPTGREVEDLAVDPSGRLVLHPRDLDEIWIYEQPTTSPAVGKLPDGVPPRREVELRRLNSGIVLRADGEKILFRLGSDGSVTGLDTLAAGKAAAWAYAPDGSFWFYKAGDRKIRGGRDGKNSIRLNAPLPPKSLLAVGPDGTVWAYDPTQGRLSGYTSNGFPKIAYAISPAVLDPAGLWIDGASAFWIADARQGSFMRYVP